MKNHFIFSYYGNKRDEVEKIYSNLDLSNIDTIIEPFCGTSALSYYISSKNPKQFNYILNDNDSLLIELYKILSNDKEIKNFETKINNILKDDFNKDKYNSLDIKTLEGYFIKNKIHAIRPGLFPLNYKYKEIKLNDYPIVNFLQTEKITFLNNNAIDILKNHYDNDKNLIFLDPPYLSTCNQWYSSPECNIYEYLFENDIKKFKSNIVLVLENIWIIKLLFKNQKQILYNKLYQTSKKKTEHVMILNK